MDVLQALLAPEKGDTEQKCFESGNRNDVRMQQIGVTAAVVSPRPISIGHTGHLTQVTPIFQSPLRREKSFNFFTYQTISRKLANKLMSTVEKR